MVQGKSGNADAAACGTPSFLWLLRDFYLQLADDAGRPITASDYLEAALAPVPAGTADAGGKNETRRAIRGLFPDRECAALVRPASDEADLQRLDDMDPASLRPEFRAGLDAVSARVFSLARPKRLGATTLTGPALARLTQAYVDALNAGAVPAIATAWAGVAEQEEAAANSQSCSVTVNGLHRMPPSPVRAGGGELKLAPSTFRGASRGERLAFCGKIHDGPSYIMTAKPHNETS